MRLVLVLRGTYAFAVDVHHEIFDPKTGSDLSGPVHWLCPTHHHMIRRGFAEYRAGTYVVLVDLLRDSAERKAELFDNYFGDSWAEK